MMLEDRLIDHLRSTAEELTVGEADLAHVIARGRRRRATRYVAVGAVVGAVVAGAFFGAQVTAPHVTPPVAAPASFTATLTDTGCSAHAPVPIEAGGMTTFTVENQTSSLASFQLIRLLGTYEDFTRAFADIKRMDLIGVENDMDAVLAPVIEEGQRIHVDPGESDEIISEVTPGGYAMWCITLDEHEDVVTARIAGPYPVEG